MRYEQSFQRPEVATRADPAEPSLVDFAVHAAERAGRITLEWYQRSDLAVTAKQDGSPVTQADLAVERFLRSEIARECPEDSFRGEEEGDSGGRSGRTWIVDPIDGTQAFTQGVPLYATLLALIDEAGPALGVICLPALAEMVWAGRGLGARWNGAACQVSRKQGLDGAFVCTSGLSYWPEPALGRLRAAGAKVRTWGDAYGYALVATGRADAMIDPECFDWDVAAMTVIVSEAGGRFSDASGAYDWRNGSAIASNGVIHADLLECLRLTSDAHAEADKHCAATHSGRVQRQP